MVFGRPIAAPGIAPGAGVVDDHGAIGSPTDILGAFQAGQGDGGRAYADPVFGGVSMRRAIQNFCIDPAHPISDAPALNTRITEINATQDPQEFSKKIGELQDWLKGYRAFPQPWFKNNAIDMGKFYKDLCITPPPGATPGRAQDAAGAPGAKPGDAAGDAIPAEVWNPEGVSPARALRDKAGVGAAGPIGADRAEIVGERAAAFSDDSSPARRVPGLVAGTSGEEPSPGRRPGEPAPDPDCLDVPNGGGPNNFPQNPGQQDQQQAANPGSGDSQGPSNDSGAPSGAPPGGGAGYQSKNKGLKDVDIAKPERPDQLNIPGQPDGSCPLCSSIAEAGRWKGKYDPTAAQGIIGDLNSYANTIRENTPPFTPFRAKKPTQGPTLQQKLSGKTPTNKSPFDLMKGNSASPKM